MNPSAIRTSSPGPIGAAAIRPARNAAITAGACNDGATAHKCGCSIMRQIPVRRLGTPRDIADVVVFLCRPLADYLNGTTILIDGGFTAHYSLNLPG
ncbi:MAG TPA: SDR family oxidoreductase [Chloroflexota bacterium]|nr:SDR family oxidoreductase [Chloroflexota bacterium]